MGVDVDAMLDRWVYDPEHTLRSRLDALKGDLDCGDKEVAEQAAAEASAILTLLHGAMPAASREERQRSLEEALVKSGLPAERIQAMAKRESRFTGRNPGRPREMAQDALRALTLYLRTEKSWREIALEVKGCNHVCRACGRVKSKPFEVVKQVRRSRPRCPKCNLTLLPKAEVKRSCNACGDAIRHLVEEYFGNVVKKGFFTKVPPRRAMKGMSAEEIERLWPPRP